MKKTNPLNRNPLHAIPTKRVAAQIAAHLRTPEVIKSWVTDRVEHMQSQGYTVDRVRHTGSAVGDIYYLKRGEIRIAIDAPRGKYRTAFCVILPPSFGYC